MCKWRQRFVESRLDGWPMDSARFVTSSVSYRSRRCWWLRFNAQPADATHWSRASMAELSKSTVGRIWKAFGLKPHLVDTFIAALIHSSSTRSAMSSRLYLDPPEKALVLCVDVKWQIQAWTDRRRAADDAWAAEQRTHDYLRHGITTLFAALDVATGE